MGRFAHMGDCHIGAWRDQKLRELNLTAFTNALDKCVTEQVDFIIIAGDLFDTTLPDLSLARKAVEKIKEVKDAGITFYLTYGSHDFAPNSVSIIDILTSTGLFKKVVDAEITENKLKLKFTTDAKTGAKIAGLSGRRLGLEKRSFEMLDTQNLECEQGFKIFVFHSAIIELRSQAAAHAEGVPLSCFPRSFSYYAGGHVHEKLEHKVKDYGLMVYPGALFGATFTDLEETAQGEKRGFYLIDFEDKITQTCFVEIKVADIYFHEINATKKTAKQTEENLKITAEGAQVKDKIALLKVTGELSSGKPSDINFTQIKQTLLDKQAMFVSINHYGLSTEEKLDASIKGENRQEIEAQALADMVNSFKIDPALKHDLKLKLEKALIGNAGVVLANNLLESLKIEQKDGETKRDYEDRLLKNTLHLLGLEDQP